MQQRIAQLVAWVREHAVENYQKDGWDVLVECWDDEDVAKCWDHKPVSLATAIAACRRVVRGIDGYRRDVQGA